jgi:hypothetical protein
MAKVLQVPFITMGSEYVDLASQAEISGPYQDTAGPGIAPPVDLKRSVLVDFLRGLCLLLMTVDHLPLTLVRKFTWQTFGFFSAAEGFVFLSGLVSGLVYGRTAITEGVGAAVRRALRRAFTLYVTNAVWVTLAILGAVAGFVTLGAGNQPSWTLWSRTLLCIASPVYSDILRMYCIFLLLLPAVIWALLNKREAYVALISGGLWLAALCGYGMAALPGTGYFDIMSWQLLFMAGVYLGFRRLRNRREVGAPAWATVVCVAVAATFLVLRHWHFLTGQHLPAYFEWLWSWRRTLSLGRLLDFAAFSFLVYATRGLLSRPMRSLPGSAIAFLGQHSLQVFVWSVSAGMIVCENESRWTLASAEAHPLLYTVLILFSCFIPAWLHAKWQAMRRAKSGAVAAGDIAQPALGLRPRVGDGVGNLAPEYR